MFGLSLLSPIFLIGALAVAAPIIFHLMQRKRARVVPFGTLRFLREIHARLSMRRRIREMILLALRIALILFIALAMARPVLKGSAFAGNEDAPVTMVFIVDNSLSMGAQIGGVTNFERGRSLLLSQLEGMRTNDRMVVIPIIAEQTEEGAVKNEPLPAGALLEESITKLRQGFGVGDPNAAVRRAVDILNSADTTNLEVYFLSDFQLCTWDSLDTAAFSGLSSDTLERVAVYAVDFTNRGLRNAAARNPSVRRGFGPGAVVVEADIVNFSKETFDVKVAVLLNGKKIGERMIPLPAEGKEPFDLEIPLSDEGCQRIVIQIDGDDLAADNQLFLSYFSSPVIHAMIVNGRPNSVPTLDACYYLRSALDPGWKRGSLGLMGISTTLVTPDELSPQMLESANVVFLVDAPAFSPSLRDTLFAFVRAGGGLVVVPGSQVIPQQYNEILSRPIGTEPLLPCLVRALVKSDKGVSYFVNFASLSMLHPIWAGIPEKALQDLCNEPITEVTQLEIDPSVPDVETLASLENGWPAIVSARSGLGRVVLLGFSLDRQDSSLPLRTVYPPLCHRLAHFASNTLVGLRKQVEIGKPLTLYLRKTAGDAVFKVKYPSGELSLTPTLKDDGFQLSAPGSQQPGFVFFEPNPKVNFSGYLSAVNAPHEESRPEFFNFDSLKAKIGFSSMYAVEDPGRLTEIRSRLKTGTPMWGILFFLVILLLAVETFMGNDLVKRTLAGRRAEAATLGPLSKNAIQTLRRRRQKKEAG